MTTDKVCAESFLCDVFPTTLRKSVLAALNENNILTLEDLYEVIANVGCYWYRSFPGIKQDEALEITNLLKSFESEVGEVTERFYPLALQKDITSPYALHGIEVKETSLALPSFLSGENGSNRNFTDTAISSKNDWEAIEAWLKARANNINTRSQYRKEAERFLLWCTMERRLALSSINAEDASLYLTWLEGLGRTDTTLWNDQWNLPQETWIGPKNAARLSKEWRPFNGPLGASSRKTSLTVIRLLFNFLTKTNYLRFNPFDQVSSKVRLLPGEGAPQQFADRSLTPSQWNAVIHYLDTLPDTKDNARMKVILSLGKGLGMRASEMIHAQTGWLKTRRIADEDLLMIEIVGKGDKVRRLPVSEEIQKAINYYLGKRELPLFTDCPDTTPLIVSGGIGRKPATTGISRSGLYRALENFFEGAALSVERKSASDAAKLRAGSTHWLRHTFATTALKTMTLNIVQNAMGHASIGTTSRYLTPEEAEIARAMKKMKTL